MPECPASLVTSSHDLSRHGSCFRQDGLPVGSVSPLGKRLQGASGLCRASRCSGHPRRDAPSCSSNCWKQLPLANCRLQLAARPLFLCLHHRPPSLGTTAGVPGRLSGMECGGAGAPRGLAFCLLPPAPPPACGPGGPRRLLFEGSHVGASAATSGEEGQRPCKVMSLPPHGPPFRAVCW